MNDSYVVYGIDLGTTNSCIAAVSARSGQAEVKPNEDGDATTPSVVYFEKDNPNPIVGKEARRWSKVMPSLVCEHVKRQMGLDDWRFKVRGREYRPEALSAMVLKKVIGDALKYDERYDPRPKAVVSVPAYFGSKERKATHSAGELAGLEVLDLPAEPVAAAFAYGFYKVDSPQNLLVYDLGGGTFDVTVVSVDGRSAHTIATDGVRLLGGADWDAALVQHCCEKFRQEHGFELPGDNAELNQRLFEEAEQAKHALSRTQKTVLPVFFDGTTTKVELTVDEFEAITYHLMASTLEKTEAVIEAARAKGVTKIDKLLLVGGSSRMRAVKRCLQEKFSLEGLLHDPDQAIAKGAALIGDLIRRGEYHVDTEGASSKSRASGGSRDLCIISFEAEELQEGIRQEQERIREAEERALRIDRAREEDERIRRIKEDDRIRQAGDDNDRLRRAEEDERIRRVEEDDRIRLEAQLRILEELRSKCLDNSLDKVIARILETELKKIPAGEGSSPALSEKESLHGSPAEPEGERRISAWITERSDKPQEPLLEGETYTLNFKIGTPVASSLISGTEAIVPATEIPERGLETEWVIISDGIEMAALTPDVSVTAIPMAESKMWSAQFSLLIPARGESHVPQLQIIPRSAEKAQLEVLIYSRARKDWETVWHKDLYRQFTLQLKIFAPEKIEEKPALENAVRLSGDVVQTSEAHLNLRPANEWKTPPGEIHLAIFSNLGSAYVKGTAMTSSETLSLDQMTPWVGNAALVKGPIDNVRKSAERFRAAWGSYLNDVDSGELLQRLTQIKQNQWHQYDWNLLHFHEDSAHLQKWSEVSASDQLRDLAIDGHSLYQAFFPQGASELRKWIDALLPGHRVNISWKPRDPGWIPHVPWGLMYLLDPAGPIDPMGFLGLRFRIEYQAYDVPDGKVDLGHPQKASPTFFFYWGDQTQDETGAEARWQRQHWGSQQNHLFVPSSTVTDGAKAELLNLLRDPGRPGATVLYLFCQCSVGEGSDPVLRFGGTNNPADVVKRTELSQQPLKDRPLVFANACTTSAADPYIANEIERQFFNRGCRAYLGTETKVPIQFASRFATIFFSYLYRIVDPDPISAGEAIAQARLFLWTQYRNLGGIFYTYVNQYELFMSDNDEIKKMRI